MKILMIADVLFPDTVGGAGRVLYNLSLELNKKGHEVYIATRNPAGKLLSYQLIEKKLSVYRFIVPETNFLMAFLFEILNSYKTINKLRKIKFDIICVHQSLPAFGPLFFGRIKNIPLIHYFHSPWHEEFLMKKHKPSYMGSSIIRAIALLMRKIEFRVLSQADAAVVLSDYMESKLIKIHPKAQQNICKISGGVDLERFNVKAFDKTEAKKQKKLSVEKTIFLTVRNLVPRMGLENLVEAFNRSKLLRKSGLLLIGGKGVLEGHLKEKARDCRLNESIMFLGRIAESELSDYYFAADFFVLPTRKLEGFGLVILEAMASGTPVIGTPVGAIPEVLGAFDKNLLFNGTSWRDIRQKLEEVIEGRSEIRHSSVQCRRFVENKYSWKKVADRFEKLAKDIIDNR